MKKRKEFTFEKYWENSSKNKTRQITKSVICHEIIKNKNECEWCNSKLNIQVHHNNYDDPTDILFLCTSCHAKLHSIDEMKPKQPSKYISKKDFDFWDKWIVQKRMNISMK